MQTMEDEWIHLISHPSDDKSYFTNKLAKQFEFDANDQTFVGLKEISFPSTLKSQHIVAKSTAEVDKVRLGVSIPYIIGEKFVNIDVEDGFYSADTLVAHINERFKAKLGPKLILPIELSEVCV